MKNSRRNTKDTGRDTDNTEETQRKITRKKTSIWKHDVAFLNFFINITFTILATFQILVLITLSTLRPWATHDARFSSADELFLSYFQLFLETGSKLVFTKFKVNRVLFLRRNVLVWGYWCCAENQHSKNTGFVKTSKEEYDYYGFNINSLPLDQSIY